MNHPKAGANKAGTRSMIDFTFISNPIGPSNRARHAMRKAVKNVPNMPDKEADLLMRYLCQKEGVPEEQILLGHGASHILTLLLQTFMPHSIVLPSPVPLTYQTFLQKLQIAIHPLALDYGEDFKIDSERFKDYWRSADAALVLNPNNPTGAIVAPALLIDFIETSSQLSKLLIIDETLRDFTGNPSQVQRAVQTGGVIVLRTFSLYYALAGLRLGYALGHPALLSKVRERMEPWPLNSMALSAALASLKDKGYRRRTAQFLSRETGYGLKKLRGLERVRPTATPWGFFIRVQPAIPYLQNLFLEKGILIEEYGDAQKNQYLSFPFRSHRENAQFFRVLYKILREHSQP